MKFYASHNPWEPVPMIEVVGVAIYRNQYKYVQVLYMTSERRGIFEWDETQKLFIQLVDENNFTDRTCDYRNIKKIIRGNIKLRIMQKFGLSKSDKIYFRISWQIEHGVTCQTNQIRSYYDNANKPTYTIPAW